MNIDGKENLILRDEMGKLTMFTNFIISPIVISLALVILTHDKEGGSDTEHFWQYFQIIFAVFVVFYPITIKRNREIRRLKKLNNYFRSKFHILNEFNPEKHENLGVVYAKDMNTEVAMFKIYKDAYKAKADAVVINNSNTEASSYDAINIMATLVKYKNTKVAIDEKKEELEIEEAMA